MDEVWESQADWWQARFTRGVDAEYTQQILPLLAERLAGLIEARFDPATRLDLLGFSMGGVIGRTWLQLLGGHRRLRRFTCLGSPQQGTWTAQPWPRRLFPGLADLRCGSALLQELNSDLEGLRGVECHSFYSALDLAVLPGWRAVLPVGTARALPVATHPQLLRDPAALRPLVQELLRI